MKSVPAPQGVTGIVECICGQIVLFLLGPLTKRTQCITLRQNMGRVQHGYCTTCQLVLPGRNFGPLTLQQPSHLWRCLRCEDVCSCIHCGKAHPLSSFKASERQKPPEARTCISCSFQESFPDETGMAPDIASSSCFGAANAFAFWRLVISRLCDRLPAEVLPKLLQFLGVPPSATISQLLLGREWLCFRCDRILSASQGSCPCQGVIRRAKPRWRKVDASNHQMLMKRAESWGWSHHSVKVWRKLRKHKEDYIYGILSFDGGNCKESRT
eukprot:symbB.v1.2.035023.t1/scaffold4632.1/size37117/2